MKSKLENNIVNIKYISYFIYYINLLLTNKLNNKIFAKNNTYEIQASK